MSRMPTRDLNTLKRRQQLLYVLIFSLVTIALWAAFDIFRSQERVDISKEELQLAAPLNPNLDVEIIQSLQRKKSYSESELSDFPIYVLLRNQQERSREILTLEAYRSRQTAVAEERSALEEQIQRERQEETERILQELPDAETLEALGSTETGSEAAAESTAGAELR